MACKCKDKSKYYVRAGEDIPAGEGNDKKVGYMVFTNAAVNKDPIKEGKTIDWAITTKEVHKNNLEVTCKLKNMLDYVKSKFSFAKTGNGLQKYEEYIKILCKEIDKIAPVSNEQKCKDNLNDTGNSDHDDLREKKENCNATTHKWDYTTCKCVEKPEKEKEKKITKVIGCMDETATNYDSKYNTKCEGCCRYIVPLAPISYNISFYKIGEFPLGKKVTLVQDRATEGVCVLQREYDNIGDDGLFYGYQDDNVPSLVSLEDDRFKFKGDVGFYGDSDKTDLISDVNRAITWYMSKAAKNTKTIWDDCTPSIASIKNIIVEIKDEAGVNHGIIRFGGENPTLRIDEPSPAKWLDYRVSNTPSGIASSVSDIKIYNVKEERFYNITCDIWMADKHYTSRSEYECVKNDGGWITLRKKVVSESTIGLGTLLEKKEKPPIGLGSLLED